MQHTSLLFLRILIYSLLTLSISNTYSQTYNFKIFNEDAGLPQSYVYKISQNKQGFLNISTGEGLSVFDGLKFTNYTTKNGLQENNTTCNFTDSRNITWVGHFQNGISYIENNKCYKLKKTDSLETKILSFAEWSNGRVFFGTQSKGLFYINSVKKIIAVPLSNDITSINKILIINNEFYIASNSGLYIYQFLKDKLILKHSFSQLENFDVKAIYVSEKNKQKLFAITNDIGVSIINIETKLVDTISKEQLQLQALNFTSIVEDFFGNLWVGTFGEGVRKIDYKDLLNSDFSAITKIDAENKLPSNYIQTIFQDYEGNIWLGTFGSGLIQIPVDKFDYFSSNEAKYPNGITAIYLDNENNLCLGTSKGLFITSNHNLESVFAKPETAILASNYVTAVAQDSLLNYYVGTLNNGLFYVNKKTKAVINISAKFKISTLTINDIKITKKNNLVVATTDGVYFINTITNNSTHLTTLEGLLHNNVSQVFIDSKNRTWFSSLNAPPYFIIDNEITKFSDIDSLKSYDIIGITEDLQKNIWIATQSDGVLKFENEKFKIFNTKNGLLSNFCYSINSDKNGNVWCAHKNGLSSIDVKTTNIQTYKSGSQLLFANFNKNTTSFNDNSNLMFGSEKGFVAINNLNTYFSLQESRLSIKSISFNDSVYTNFSNINLPFKGYNFKANFALACLTNPTDVLYAYRLIGLDTVWRYTTTRSIEFPKLFEGNYTFQLKAKNTYGVWNKINTELNFNIATPFYKKWWFYLVSFLSIITLLFVVIKLRTNAILQKNLELENLVNQKTAQLQEEKLVVEKVKGELQEKNKDITDSINYALRIQNSILPSQQLLDSNFANNFVLFKPKDIVSGDFYWFAQTEEHFIVVVADCTGHGIPGAFMSLIGNALLSEIVNKDKTHLPSQILIKLNKAVVKLLHQETAAMSNDGMDMAICVINKSHTKLVFSTAIRPVYLVRNNELIEYKGGKFSIGGLSSKDKIFTDTEVDLQKDDSLFLFSDGYPDQFGGELYKRITTKRFKELLIDCAPNDCKTQKTILNNFFEEWRGDKKQIDDLLVLGIKF